MVDRRIISIIIWLLEVLCDVSAMMLIIAMLYGSSSRHVKAQTIFHHEP